MSKTFPVRRTTQCIYSVRKRGLHSPTAVQQWRSLGSCETKPSNKDKCISAVNADHSDLWFDVSCSTLNPKHIVSSLVINVQIHATALHPTSSLFPATIKQARLLLTKRKTCCYIYIHKRREHHPPSLYCSLGRNVERQRAHRVILYAVLGRNTANGTEISAVSSINNRILESTEHLLWYCVFVPQEWCEYPAREPLRANTLRAGFEGVREFWSRKHRTSAHTVRNFTNPSPPRHLAVKDVQAIDNAGLTKDIICEEEILPSTQSQ